MIRRLLVLAPGRALRPCRACGHPAQAHMHFRPGTDCSHVDVIEPEPFPAGSLFATPLRVPCTCPVYRLRRPWWQR